MSVDPYWRYRVEALRRAGLDYVDVDRLAAGGDETVESEPAGLPEPALEETVVAKKKDKLVELKLLADEVAGCTMCQELAATRTQTVFSDGTPNAELCFLGEAPGADEDAQGVPFVGRAGQLLTKIIDACKLQREEVYICNVFKCRPPQNRNPEPEEIQNCKPYLERQLSLVKPKMIVALGKFAAAHVLNRRPEDTPITKLRGKIYEYCGIPTMVTFHPAYLIYNPSAKRDTWEDMKFVMRELGRPVD